MHATINAFDAASGYAKLGCTGRATQYGFCDPEPYGGALRNGGFVLVKRGGEGLAQGVVLAWRRSSKKPVAPKPVASPVQTVTAQVGQGLEACCGVAPAMAAANDRDTCTCCGKLMTPTLALVEGVPARSFCPFCGEVHRDFTLPARTCPKDYVAEGLFSAAITAFCTIFL